MTDTIINPGTGVPDNCDIPCDWPPPSNPPPPNPPPGTSGTPPPGSSAGAQPATGRRDDPTRRTDLGRFSLGLALASLLPVPGLAAAIAAVACAVLALRSEPDPSGRNAARAGLAMGLAQIAAPFVFLFVYCVVLGYPFPLHRYHPGR